VGADVNINISISINVVAHHVLQSIATTIQKNIVTILKRLMIHLLSDDLAGFIVSPNLEKAVVSPNLEKNFLSLRNLLSFLENLLSFVVVFEDRCLESFSTTIFNPIIIGTLYNGVPFFLHVISAFSLFSVRTSFLGIFSLAMFWF
jgi:hypothetical protein